MALRAAAILAICALSASPVARASSFFCTSEICAEVAGMMALNSASTAGSLLTTRAWVRAALVSVNPVQRRADSTRVVISRDVASAWVWALDVR